MWVLVTLKENIKKILEDLSIGKNISDVFSDVIICCAYSLANLSYFNQDTLEMKIYDTFYTFDYITNKNLQKNISNYIEESKREETTQSKLESEDIDITESMF